jgi:hypothetical protein
MEKLINLRIKVTLRILIFLFFVLVQLFLYSCKKEKLKSYRRVTYRTIDIDHSSIVKNNYIFKDSISNKCYELKFYKTLQEIPAFQYILSKDSGFNYKFISKNNVKALFLEQKYCFSIDKRNYQVYKFIENKNITDGEIIHFWSPDYGILLIKSSTWNVFTKLINTDNDTTNEKVEILCDYIFNNRNMYYSKAPIEMLKFKQPEIED